MDSGQRCGLNSLQLLMTDRAGYKQSSLTITGQIATLPLPTHRPANTKTHPKITQPHTHTQLRGAVDGIKAQVNRDAEAVRHAHEHTPAKTNKLI